MGCDIHTYVEVKRNVNNIEKWATADYYRKNRYYIDYPEEEKQYEVVHIYDDRNYGLFSILAGVRNYSDNEPISQPKGLPEDCCDEIRKESDYYGIDGHSHSWFTLKELKDYANNHRTIKQSGLISQQQADNLDNNNIKPDSWCQGASPSLNMVYREWEDEFSGLDEIIKRLTQRLKDELWLYDDERVNEFSEKIRLVFWFDN